MTNLNSREATVFEALAAVPDGLDFDDVHDAVWFQNYHLTGYVLTGLVRRGLVTRTDVKTPEVEFVRRLTAHYRVA